MTAQVYSRLEDLPNRPHVVTIGNFDGVHRGHRYLLAAALERARALGAGCLTITFEPLPAEVLAPERAPERLTTTPERLALIGALGIDTILLQPFSHAFANWSADEFIERVVRAARPVAFVVGADFRFGHDRIGTPTMLREAGRRADFAVDLLGRIGGEEISSTNIRRLIASGDVRTAARLLGRPHRLTGVVQPGAQRGRELGFPTANLNIPSRLARPADGIYAALVAIDRESPLIGALVYVGTRPTFDEAERLVEVFLLDYAGDLYGRELAVSFLEQVRGDQVFTSVDALIQQMRLDEAKARRFLASPEAAEMERQAEASRAFEGVEGVIQRAE